MQLSLILCVNSQALVNPQAKSLKCNRTSAYRQKEHRLAAQTRIQKIHCVRCLQRQDTDASTNIRRTLHAIIAVVAKPQL